MSNTERPVSYRELPGSSEVREIAAISAELDSRLSMAGRPKIVTEEDMQKGEYFHGSVDDELRKMTHDQPVERIIEALAEQAHGAWSGWISYMFGKCRRRLRGDLVIPKWAVVRWDRQRRTLYEDLTENEKESDREEARRYLAVMQNTRLIAQANTLASALQAMVDANPIPDGDLGPDWKQRVDDLERECQERMRQLHVISWHVRTNGQGGVGAGPRSREALHLINEYYQHGPYLDVPSEDE